MRVLARERVVGCEQLARVGAQLVLAVLARAQLLHQVLAPRRLHLQGRLGRALSRQAAIDHVQVVVDGGAVLQRLSL